MSDDQQDTAPEEIQDDVAAEDAAEVEDTSAGDDPSEVIDQADAENQDPAEADTPDDQDADDTRISDTDRAVEQEAQPQHNWEERYKALQSDYTRRAQNEKAMQAQLQELQQRLEQQTLPPSDPRSAGHASFQQQVQTVQQFQDQIQRASTDEQRQAIAAYWESQGLTREAIMQVRQYQQEQHQRALAMANDPDQFWSQASTHVSKLVQQEMQTAQARMQYQNLFEQNKDLVDQHKDVLVSLIKGGMEPEQAIERLKAFVPSASVSQAQVNANRQLSAAAARKEAVKRKATVTRDPATGSGPKDARSLAKKWAKERGIDFEGPEMATLLWEANQHIHSEG